MYPQELEIHVTNRNLALPKNANMAQKVIEEALDVAGLPWTEVRVRDDDVIIYNGSPGHEARYFIPDDAWKLFARFASGRKVKPGLYVLPAIYVRK